MARRRSGSSGIVNDLLFYGLAVGSGYVGYQAALSGQLGAQAQEWAEKLREWLARLRLPGHCNYSPRLCDLIEDFRPYGDFKAVMDSWQDWASTQSGLMTCDWGAFKAYLLSQWSFAAGDPEPPEFSARCWYG